MAKMPKQKPGQSVQEVETPDDFYRAVVGKFGRPMFDLAASLENTKCVRFFIEKDNALLQPWPTDKLCWLNPPYGYIELWVKKCWESGAEVLVLLPASVGSEWFAKWVWGKCDIYFLRPRLTFIGHDAPYPKDLMLLHYPGSAQPSLWKWK